MHEDGQRISELKKQIVQLNEELDETYRSVTQLTNDLEKANAERLLAEEQVQHGQKLESLGVMAGGIAHDFNNILMAILGNTDLALQDLSPASPARESIEQVEKAARRAAELTQQLLAYSGHGTFQVGPVNINKVLLEITHLLEIVTSKSVVVEFDLFEHLPNIEANTAQISQIAMNLITNASEAIADASGTITVSTGVLECDDAYLAGSCVESLPAPGLFAWLQVTDTGCGMDEETMNRICDPFFTTKFTGRGLGMSAVLGITKSHQGAMLIESAPGKGAAFRFLFPVFDRRVEPRNEHQAKPPDEWRGNGTILIVDDEEVVRRLTRLMLERMGFKVLVAKDGRDGVDVFKERMHDIDIVLLDFTMPHMDGEEAFYAMRRIESDVRIIFSSGYSESEIAQRFVGKDLLGFIQKPYKMAALKDKLIEVLPKEKLHSPQ